MPDAIVAPNATLAAPTPAAPAATVALNGQARHWHEGLSIAELLAREGIAPEAVATAVNGEFVARAARAQLHLRPGDQLTLFQPIVGG